MARNPLIRSYPKRVSKPLPNKSAGILDDFAIRKVISSKEGTIEKVPVNSNDITNKAYVDTLTTDHPHQNITTVAGPTFAGLILTSQLALNRDGVNIINATHAGGDLRLGAGGGTNDLRIDTDGNIHIPENLNLTSNLNLGGDLYDNVGINLIIDMSARIFFDTSAGKAMDFENRTLHDENEDTILDWFNAGIANFSSSIIKTTGHYEQSKIKLTPVGGYAVKLTNKTGVNSVKGKLVRTRAGIDDAVGAALANELHCIGVFLDAGVVDGAEAWIVVGGIAEILGTGNAAGDRLVTGATAGSASVNNLPIVAVHFQEVGHAIDGAPPGLTRAVIHFN